MQKAFGPTRSFPQFGQGCLGAIAIHFTRCDSTRNQISSGTVADTPMMASWRQRARLYFRFPSLVETSIEKVSRVERATIANPVRARTVLTKNETVFSVGNLEAKNWSAIVVIAARKVSLNSDRSWNCVF